MFIRAVPRDVKRSLAAAARERDTGMNDIAVQALSERFGVPYEPTGLRQVRKTASGETRRAPISDSPNMTLRVSKTLEKRISVHAARTGETKRGIVVATIADALGLDAPSTKRRSRSGRRAGVAVR